MINFVREALFKQDSVYKTIDIRYWNSSTIATNVDMYNDEFSVEDILCDGEELTFGEACARKVTFATTVVEDLVGADIGVIEKLGGYNDIFSYGRFTVADERYIESKGKNKVKEVTAYDPVYTIYNTDVTDWYNGLWESASTYTQKQFRDSFFDNFGVSQCSIILDNDNMTVRRTVSGKINGATVLKSILATNGCMGRCNDSGDFEYFYLPTIAPDLSNAYEIAENGYYMSENHSKFTTQAIDKLIIRDEDSEEIITVGSGSNAYVMANNMLLYGKTAVELQTIAQNIYNKISVVTYVPFEIEVKGNPCLQVGDPIYFTTVDGEVVKSYILRRNYTGIQSQKDTYSAEGLEKRAEVTVSVNDELIKLRNKTNRLDRDLEHTESILQDEVLDPDNPLSLQSQIYQSASVISAKVDQINGTSGDSMSWEMIPTKFELKSNGSTRIKSDSSGTFIGNGSNGFQIGATSIYNGVTSISDTTHNGIYLGTDGINLGKGNFTVTNAGDLTAKSGYIGNGSNGFQIGNTYIRNGMQSLSDTSHNGVYVGTDGMALGKGNFKVTSAGSLTALSGRVGNWDIYQYGIMNQISGSHGGYHLYIGADYDHPPIHDFSIKTTTDAGSDYYAYLNINADSIDITTNSQLFSGNIISKWKPQSTALIAGDQRFNFEIPYGANYWACYAGSDGLVRLGDSSNRWSAVYAVSGTINTSDRNQKKDIKTLQDNTKDFIMKLNPVSYKFKDGESGRTHYGLIAQDVEQTMTELGMTDMDFAGFCKDQKTKRVKKTIQLANGKEKEIDVNEPIEGQYTYGLRYEEFIAPLIYMVQKLQKEVEELKGRKK